MGQPAGDHVADALRDRRAGPRRPTAKRRPRRTSRRTISPTNSGLPSVSSCSAATSSGEAISDAVSSTYCRHLALAQPAEREAAGDRLARDLGERLRQRSSRDRVDVAVGAEQQHVRRAELAGEEPQQQQRRRVGRVQVVEHEHERPALARRSGGTRRSRRRGGSAPPSDSSAGGSGRSGKRSRSSGTIWARSAAPAPSCARSAVGLAVAHVGAQRLHPRPVGGRAARLPAAADEHARAARASLRAQLLGEPALADAGLAGEQEQAAAAGERVVEAGEQLGELALAADERAARRPRPAGSAAGRAGRVPGPAARIACSARAAAGRARSRARSTSVRARVLVGLERLGLAAAAVEREHQLAAQALASGCSPISASSSPTSSAWRPSARSASIRCSSAASRSSSSRAISALRERLVGEVGERRPAPQRERLVAAFATARRAAPRQLAPASATSRSKRCEVELLGVDPQHVAGRARDEPRRRRRAALRSRET